MAMVSNARRAMVVATLVVAVMLGVSSAAWACTVWKGKFTVWGVSAGSTGTVSAVGSETGMTYCNNTTTGRADVGPVGGVARQIKLSLAVSPCGTKTDGKLPDGLYTVNYLADGGADCMNVAPIGEFMLAGGTTFGNGTADGSEGPFTITGGSNPEGGVTSTSLGGWASVCVNSVTTIFGNQVPIFLL